MSKVKSLTPKKNFIVKARSTSVSGASQPSRAELMYLPSIPLIFYTNKRPARFAGPTRLGKARLLEAALDPTSNSILSPNLPESF